MFEIFVIALLIVVIKMLFTINNNMAKGLYQVIKDNPEIFIS